MVEVELVASVAAEQASRSAEDEVEDEARSVLLVDRVRDLEPELVEGEAIVVGMPVVEVAGLAGVSAGEAAAGGVLGIVEVVEVAGGRPDAEIQSLPEAGETGAVATRAREPRPLELLGLLLDPCLCRDESVRCVAELGLGLEQAALCALHLLLDELRRCRAGAQAEQDEQQRRLEPSGTHRCSPQFDQRAHSLPPEEESGAAFVPHRADRCSRSRSAEWAALATSRECRRRRAGGGRGGASAP